MTTASAIFGQIKQENVNVRILGHVCWTSAHNVELTQDRFAAILESVGLPTSFAREHNWRSSFIRALRNMEEKRIIKLVSENKDRLIYQFTAETLQDDDTPYIDYVKETSVVIDKNKYAETGIFADSLVKGNEEIKKRIAELFEIEKTKYNSSDMNRYVQKIFRSRADIVALRNQGGVYFIPATYGEVIDAVSRMVQQIPGLTFDHLPIPDVESSRVTVRTAVNDEVLASMLEIDRDIKAVAEGHQQVTETWRKTRIGRIEAIKERIRQYSSILNGAGTDLEKQAITLESRILGRRKLEV